MACITFELLTGDLLFEPKSGKTFDKNDGMPETRTQTGAHAHTLLGIRKHPQYHDVHVSLPPSSLSLSLPLSLSPLSRFRSLLLSLISAFPPSHTLPFSLTLSQIIWLK